MAPSAFPSQLLSDRSLAPLKLLAGPASMPPPRAYMFYLKHGNLWGSDGLNHTPLNTMLLAYFEEIFRGAVQQFGRGSLFFILSGPESSRYSIVTDNRSLQASLVQYQEALRQITNTNFPTANHS